MNSEASARHYYPIRSELSVPAGNLRMIEKGLASDADVVFLDLEDSVAPALKEEARKNVAHALTALDWGRKPKSFRINGLETQWCYRDVIDIVESAGARTDRIVVPKVSSAGDVAFVDRLLNQIEAGLGLHAQIRLELQIEDPAGLISVNEIAGASPRTSEITFGQGDFAATSGMPAVDIGIHDEWDSAAPGDRWMVPRQMIVFAAKANGQGALNGSFADFRDQDGFRRYCRMSKSLGFTGVWCIHPDQIAVANEVFSPTSVEIERARLVIEALDDAQAAGRGAVEHAGVMVDAASVRMARQVLDLAAQLELP